MNKRPNILFIMADQLSRQMLSCYGNQVVKTPNIQRLADEGILLNANYVQNPICGPSRCSIFTGRRPSVNGVRVNGTPLPESERTLPQCLVDAGYRTFAAGKLHFRYQLNSMRQADGDHVEHEGTRPYYGFQEYALSDDNRIGPYTRWLQKEHPQYHASVMREGIQLIGNTRDCWIAEFPAEVHQTNWVADQTIDFIQRQPEEQPWMAFCSFTDPHHPFNPPQPYASMYDEVELPPRLTREGEWDTFPEGWNNPQHRPGAFSYTEADWDTTRRHAFAMVTLIDDAIGRVIDSLEKNGQLDSTLIVFTSDHGEMLGDHDLLYKGTFHFDQLIRTPLIWRWPDGQARGNGLRIDSLTQSMDVMPTLLEACGVPVPDAVQGQSMQPLLRGETTTGRPWVLTEHAYAKVSIWCEVNTLVTPEWKITLRSDRDTGLLYDRRNDPQELNNLWSQPDYGALRSELTEALVIAQCECKEHPWRREAMW